jgi:hypothetical protein
VAGVEDSLLTSSEQGNKISGSIKCGNILIRYNQVLQEEMFSMELFI